MRVMSAFGPVPYVCTTNRSRPSLHDVPGAQGVPCFALVPAISHVFRALLYTRYVSVRLRLPSLGLMRLNSSSMTRPSCVRCADQVPATAGLNSVADFRLWKRMFHLPSTKSKSVGVDVPMLSWRKLAPSVSGVGTSGSCAAAGGTP